MRSDPASFTAGFTAAGGEGGREGGAARLRRGLPPHLPHVGNRCFRALPRPADTVSVTSAARPGCRQTESGSGRRAGRGRAGLGRRGAQRQPREGERGPRRRVPALSARRRCCSRRPARSRLRPPPGSGEGWGAGLGLGLRAPDGECWAVGLGLGLRAPDGECCPRRKHCRQASRVPPSRQPLLLPAPPAGSSAQS